MLSTEGKFMHSDVRKHMCRVTSPAGQKQYYTESGRNWNSCLSRDCTGEQIPKPSHGFGLPMS